MDHSLSPHLPSSRSNSDSSPPSVSRVSNKLQNSSSFAFLNHSQDTFPNNLPPTVDNKSLARQRRRRTSPEDQAVLEAEFIRDPKPDKDARSRIVNRVSLGEREVQIWFQNRRQNSRRKSRPLDLDELRNHLARSENSLSVPPASRVISASAPNSSFSSVDFPRSDSISETDANPSRCIQSSPGNISLSQECNSFKGDLHQGHAVVGNLGRPLTSPAACLDAEAPHALKRTTSQIRLSLASDGSARLVGAEEASPSPPRSQPIRPLPSTAHRGLRRSYSEAGFDEAPPLKRVPSGRSRDSRAWEFWCDSEARNELVKKADQENTGSASEAIRLMRSNSRGALTQNFNKRNVRLGWVSSKGSSSDMMKKPRRELGRAHSSIARFSHQREKSLTTASILLEEKPEEGGKRCDSLSDGVNSDSDKENKEPGDHSGRRPITNSDHSKTTQKSRTVLGQARSPPSTSRDSLGILLPQERAKPQRTKSIKVHKEIFNPEADDEISAFMSSERNEGEVPKGEDLDCIQGLLSLSQGNWK